MRCPKCNGKIYSLRSRAFRKGDIYYKCEDCLSDFWKEDLRDIRKMRKVFRREDIE